jgi:hypothetical protein
LGSLGLIYVHRDVAKLALELVDHGLEGVPLPLS